jgi:glycerophosphoryl diester phosphodiesterase
MADEILIPKDTPNWQSILTQTENERQGAENARIDAEDAAENISQLGGIDGTVRTEADLPASSGSRDFYYVIQENSYYEDTGSGLVEGGWEKIVTSRETPRNFDPKPSIIAHRGFSQISPENTIASITYADKYGANAVELDVRYSSDRVPVIMHDTTVDRTTDGSGKVENKTLSELKNLDAGSWFGGRFEGCRIPTLQEAFDVFIESNLDYMVLDQNRGTVQELGNIAQDIVDRGLEDSIYISTIETNRINEIKSVSKRIYVGRLENTRSGLDNAIDELSDFFRTFVNTNKDTLLDNTDLIEKARNNSVDLLAYTVNDVGTVVDLYKAGVNNIITDKLTQRLQ